MTIPDAAASWLPIGTTTSSARKARRVNFALKRPDADSARPEAPRSVEWPGASDGSSGSFLHLGVGDGRGSRLSLVAEASAAAGVRGRYSGGGRSPGYRRSRKANFFSGRKHGRLLRFYLPSPAAGGIRGWRIRRTRPAPSADITAGESAGGFSDLADLEGS